MPRKYLSLPERFWCKVRKSDGCWEWTANRNQSGYGMISNSKWRSAHRVSWEMANGQIPDGLCVLHKCDNPPCVRPDHLFLGTFADNNRDRAKKGRTVSVLTDGLSKLTACKRGHAFDEKNTRIRRDTGHRICITCQNARNLISNEKQKEARRRQ